jgi:hypothetical protein
MQFFSKYAAQPWYPQTPQQCAAQFSRGSGNYDAEKRLPESRMRRMRRRRMRRRRRRRTKKKKKKWRRRRKWKRGATDGRSFRHPSSTCHG